MRDLIIHEMHEIQRNYDFEKIPISTVVSELMCQQTSAQAVYTSKDFMVLNFEPRFRQTSKISVTSNFWEIKFMAKSNYLEASIPK